MILLLPRMIDRQTIVTVIRCYPGTSWVYTGGCKGITLGR